MGKKKVTKQRYKVREMAEILCTSNFKFSRKKNWFRFSEKNISPSHCSSLQAFTKKQRFTKKKQRFTQKSTINSYTLFTFKVTTSARGDDKKKINKKKLDVRANENDVLRNVISIARVIDQAMPADTPITDIDARRRRPRAPYACPRQSNALSRDPTIFFPSPGWNNDFL